MTIRVWKKARQSTGLVFQDIKLRKFDRIVINADFMSVERADSAREWVFQEFHVDSSFDIEDGVERIEMVK